MNALKRTFSLRRWDALGCGARMIVLGVFIAIAPCVAGAAEQETTGPEKGVLLIHGGGKFNAGQFVGLVRKASGKKQPVIRVITIAQGKRRAEGFRQGVPFGLVKNLKKRYRLDHVTELYTLSKQEANTPEFVGQIDSADAVYMSGGNQCYLTDALLDTDVMGAFERLLERGGVIAGASAGAQVQSSFMTRGDYTKRRILGDKKHQEGFSFVTNSVFDVHVEERGREEHLLQVFRAKPSQLQVYLLNPMDLLGIGIDQGTAIVVRQNRFEVTGTGKVYIFDPRRWDQSDPESWGFKTLASGTHFDMVLREVMTLPRASRQTSGDSK